MLGVVITVLSFIALLTILGLYFAEVTPAASLYWVALWGFPVGFILMCVYLLLNIRGRRQKLG